MEIILVIALLLAFKPLKATLVAIIDTVRVIAEGIQSDIKSDMKSDSK